MNIMNNNADTINRFQTVLAPLSGLYGTAAFLRRKSYSQGFRKPRRLPCPTISIGNITTGGTGKTPMTIYLALILQKAGLTPLVVSRGYKGSASPVGGIVSDGRHILMSAAQSGDEPLLMAKRLAGVPVAVGKKRYDIAMTAIRRFSPDVILLDDGFQHFQLARDMDIVLLDNAHPLGNNRLLPAGPLREPLATLRLADIIVFTRADRPGRAHPENLREQITEKPVFYACHVPVISQVISRHNLSKPDDQPQETDVLAHRRAFVLSGLADNSAFLDSVRELGTNIIGHQSFPDHHAYSAEDLAGVCRAARESKAEIIVTSGKDHVRFRDRALPDLPCDLVVLDVNISFTDRAERFEEQIRTRIKKRGPHDLK